MAEKSLLASVLVAVSQVIKNNPISDAEAIQDIDVELRRVLSAVLESPMLVISDCRSACAEIHSLLTDNPIETYGDISDLVDATEVATDEEPKNFEMVQQFQDLADATEEIAQEYHQDKLYALVDVACATVYDKTQVAKALIDAQVSKRAKRFDRLTEDQQAFVYGQIEDLQYALEQLNSFADDNDVSLHSAIAEFDEELASIHDEFESQVNDSDYDHSEGQSLVDLRNVFDNLDKDTFKTDR